MATPATAPKQRTLSDVYADRVLSDAQIRRIVALLGLAGSAQRTPDANDPQPTTDRLGA